MFCHLPEHLSLLRGKYSVRVDLHRLDVFIVVVLCRREISVLEVVCHPVIDPPQLGRFCGEAGPDISDLVSLVKFNHRLGGVVELHSSTLGLLDLGSQPLHSAPGSNSEVPVGHLLVERDVHGLAGLQRCRPLDSCQHVVVLALLAAVVGHRDVVLGVPELDELLRRQRHNVVVALARLTYKNLRTQVGDGDDLTKVDLHHTGLAVEHHCYVLLRLAGDSHGRLVRRIRLLQ